MSRYGTKAGREGADRYWKWLLSGEIKKEEQAYKKKYKEELKDWTKYSRAKNKWDKRTSDILKAKDAISKIVTMSMGLGSKTGDKGFGSGKFLQGVKNPLAAFSKGGGGGGILGALLGIADMTGGIDYGIAKFMDKITSKDLNSRFLKNMDFLTMDPTTWAWLTPQVKDVEDEFSLVKDEERYQRGQAKPRFFDYLMESDLLNPQGDTTMAQNVASLMGRVPTSGDDTIEGPEYYPGDIPVDEADLDLEVFENLTPGQQRRQIRRTKRHIKKDERIGKRQERRSYYQ